MESRSRDEYNHAQSEDISSTSAIRADGSTPKTNAPESDLIL